MPAFACVPAAPPPERGRGGHVPVQAHLTEIIDGNTLKLEGGAELRLSGLLAPPSGTPFAAEAKAALERLTRGATLRLFAARTPFDRYGRILAQLYVEGPNGGGPNGGGSDPARWVQGRMLEEGFARVSTLKDNRDCAAALLAKEGAARAARRGLWALPAYQPLNAASVPSAQIGRFVLVEGKVRVVSDRGKRAYLNFGADYRTDFTAVIEPRDLALFRTAGYDLGGLAGRRVRVRGWLERWNGPFIAVTHPEQIEPLDGS